MAAAAAEASTALSGAVLDQYKAAATIAGTAIKAVIEKAVDGAKVVDLCQLGDKTIEQESEKVYNAKKAGSTISKGSSFPTTVSINSVICGYAPLPSDEKHSGRTLSKGDVVKVVAGAQIGGHAVLTGETIVVGASASEPVKGLKADLLAAAHNAAEAALRSVKAGERSTIIPTNVDLVLKEFDGVVKGVNGFVGHQHLENEIAGAKTIRVFATPEQRRDKDNSHILEEGDVFALDVVVTTGSETSFKTSEAPTTIYGRVGAAKYDLKLKTSRAVFSEIQKKAGHFPFSLRILEDENRAKFSVKDCATHGLLRAWEVLEAPKPEDLTAQVHLTFAVTKTGAVRLSTPPVFYSTETVKPDHEIKSEEAKALLSRPLKPARAKAPKAVSNGAAPAPAS